MEHSSAPASADVTLPAGTSPPSPTVSAVAVSGAEGKNDDGSREKSGDSRPVYRCAVCGRQGSYERVGFYRLRRRKRGPA